MSHKNVHVTHRADKSWAVITAGSVRAVSLHKTQNEATKVGRNIAINNKSELVIHDTKNLIRDKDSFGNDPSSIKDMKH